MGQIIDFTTWCHHKSECNLFLVSEVTSDRGNWLRMLSVLYQPSQHNSIQHAISPVVCNVYKYESSSNSEIDGPLSKRGVPLKQNVSTKSMHWVLDHYSTDGLYVLTVLRCWPLRVARPSSFRVGKFGIQASSFVTHFWPLRNKYLMTATWELRWL